MNNKETHSRTWFVDIDGTIFEDKTNDEIDIIIQNYKFDSYLQEKPIPKNLEFFRNLPKKDKIIITTARETKHREHTLKALEYHRMPYDDYIFDLGSGPRIVVNDIKPANADGNLSPLDTAYAINVERDENDNSCLNKKFLEIRSKYVFQMCGNTNEKETQLIQE